MASVAIVMATYDGAPYVEEQIRSIQRQDLADWRLYVRDDCSTDGTRDRVAALARNDRRITVLESGTRLGTVGNFGELLEHARDEGADYVFPCDQDDVWHRTKVSRALAEMARLESAHGPATPLLVHSDLEVVDARLRTLHPSFLSLQGLWNEPRRPLQVLLVQNFVTGCASLLNRALLELVVPVPGSCAMHDWWIAQVAAASGAIGFVPEPTVRYRQHARNQVGASSALVRWGTIRSTARSRLARKLALARAALEQASALEERLRERSAGSPDALALVRKFAALTGERPLHRAATLLRLGVHRQRAAQTPLALALLSIVTVRGAERPSIPSG